MNKKMLITLFSFFLMLFSETCYGIGDGGFGGQVGNAGESIETEGYYLVFALKELVENAVKCDCSCTKKCRCPYGGGPCDCPVADPMKGALALFGRLGNRKSALPKIKNIISKDDYAPYLLTELALRRSDDKEDERAALKITVMDEKLIKMVQGNPDEKGKMQKGILPEARKELQKWALEQIKIPVSKEKALEKFEKVWGWEKSDLVLQDDQYLRVTCNKEKKDCKRPTDAAFELIQTEMNTLKHTGVINNYALSKAYMVMLDSGKTEASAALNKVVSSGTFQEKYQNLGELELQTMLRLNELGKLSAKYTETAAVDTFLKMLDILREEETEEETE